MRLFVALPLSNDLRAALVEWMKHCGEQSCVRWTRPEQLHITLQFLGEIAEQRLHSLIDALSGISASQFEVRIAGPEALGHGAILAAAVEPASPVASLAQAIRRNLAPFVPSVHDSDRGFRSHITLGRARRGDSVPKPQHLPPLPALIDRATCFRLYRSELRPEGAVHAVIREWPLTPAPIED